MRFVTSFSAFLAVIAILFAAAPLLHAGDKNHPGLHYIVEEILKVQKEELEKLGLSEKERDTLLTELKTQLMAMAEPVDALTPKPSLVPRGLFTSARVIDAITPSGDDDLAPTTPDPQYLETRLEVLSQRFTELLVEGTALRERVGTGPQSGTPFRAHDGLNQSVRTPELVATEALRVYIEMQLLAGSAHARTANTHFLSGMMYAILMFHSTFGAAVLSDVFRQPLPGAAFLLFWTIPIWHMSASLGDLDKNGYTLLAFFRWMEQVRKSRALNHGTIPKLLEKNLRNNSEGAQTLQRVARENKLELPFDHLETATVLQWIQFIGGVRMDRVFRGMNDLSPVRCAQLLSARPLARVPEPPKLEASTGMRAVALPPENALQASELEEEGASPPSSRTIYTK